MRFLFSLLLTVTFTSAALAQRATPPTPASYLGYEIGARFTPHHAIVGYMRALSASTPRVRMVTFGETYEGRPLTYVVVSSEANLARLDEIRETNLRLTDPRVTPSAEAKPLAADAPVIVWLAYGVHGDESSSPEAAMLTAHALATADEALLQQVVVIIDPSQNPDGRDRYVQSYQQRRGRTVNPEPSAWEHSDAWPAGRFNHYLVDMNRDWAWASQKETRARVAEFQRWNPQVFVDLHEMAPNATYFFPPGAKPVNANVPQGTEKWLETFGRANAGAFTSRQWPFFVGEHFDLFYPGYGDSYPALRGAVGMTYEVAGSRRGGLAWRRADDSVLTLAHRAQQHFVASMTTVETAAANREALLLHSNDARRASLTAPRITYVFPANHANSEAIARLLALHGVEVTTLKRAMRIKGTDVHSGRTESRDYPAGSIAVTTHQPDGGLVRTLFERSPRLEEAFIEEQKERIAADEEDDFYDITAWSLPIAMNVPTLATDVAVDGDRWVAPAKSGVTLPSAAYAYVMKPDQVDFHRATARLLNEGVKFSIASRPIDRNVGRGSIVIERRRNQQDLDDRVRRALDGTNATLVGVNEVWSEGFALGSGRLFFVRTPRIAIVTGPQFDASSFGMIWHTFDVEMDVAHSVVELATLRSRDLAKYNVVILPDGRPDLVTALGKDGIETLKRWINDGGTLIAIKQSAAALRMKEVDLSNVEEWTAKKETEKDAEEKEDDARRFDYRIPGSAFATVMNDRSHLTFGVTESPVVLIEGTRAITPLPRKAENIVSVVEKEPLVAGFAWPESLDRIRNSVYLTRERVGGGSVITFADQPYYRLFWRSTLPLLMNAALFTPTFNEEE
jgi:hypothetical protein